jgi:protein gp37
MAEHSKIEWTDSTFAPWHGCTRVSNACDFCYAEYKIDHRFHKAQWGNHPRIRAADSTWENVRRWNQKNEPGHRGPGYPRMIFCSELSDVFDNQVPDEWRADLWKLIAQCTNLDWQLLTKRPQNIEKMLPDSWPLPHVWLGVTAENQTEWNRRVPILTSIPAAVRFVSCEPLLEPIKMNLTDISGLIVGGETDPAGKHRERYMDPDWARNLLHQCRTAGVRFFMKQMSSKSAIPHDLMVREWPQH